MEKVMITAALTGSGITKQAAPTVPHTPQEIAAQTVEVAQAGAAIVHIHVRDDHGVGTMDTDRFVETFSAVKSAVEKAGLDIIVNLTTSGSETPVSNALRQAHLGLLHPEICSFDAGTMNWNYYGVFYNTPDFLDELSATVVRENIKPEFEIFDSGMIANARYYIEKHHIPAPWHFQFVMGVGGGAPGTIKHLQFLRELLPVGSTWSVTGIGRAHMPMLLAGLAMGADGVRVGLEDNLYLSAGKKATNAELVAQAAQLIRLSGKEPATAAEARVKLGITRSALREYI